MNKTLAGFLLVLLASAAYFIWYTVQHESVIGAYILGIFSTLSIGLIFYGLQLISAYIYALNEQKRFQDNAKENLANMLAQQRLQNEQTRGALMLANDNRKQQPQDEGNYLVFDESLFDEME